MKLGDILGAGFEAPHHKVTFKVIGKDRQGSQVVADASAVLAFVSEDDRKECWREADRETRKKYPDGDAPEAVTSDERCYHLLCRALRDEDDPRQPFAGNVGELRRALSANTFVELMRTYNEFCADEFPPHVDVDTFEKLAEEAKKKSLLDLLSQYDSWTILRALPSLVARFGKLKTETSGGGELG